MRASPFISIVVPAHNEEEYIAQCLTALTQQNYPDECFEIIVVDNNSTDNTARVAKEFNVQVIHQEQGPVGAVRNAGAQIAKGDIIAFVDSDCVAPDNWLTQGISLLEKNPNTAFGGGYTLRAKPYWIEKYWLIEGESGAILPRDLVGGAIFITKTMFIEAGGFNESVTSGEDSLLSSALKTNNHNVRIERSLSVTHLGNPKDSATFFKRQVWHSENYWKDLASSLRDKTFYLITAYCLLLLALAAGLATGNYWLSAGFLYILLLIPAVFSANRLYRSGAKLTSLKQLILMYYLDTLYVLGRVTGLLKGAFYSKA